MTTNQTTELLQVVISTAIFSRCIYLSCRNAKKLDNLKYIGKIPDIQKAKRWAVIWSLSACVLPLLAFYLVGGWMDNI